MHLMLFDLYAGGHHGQYLEQLTHYWGEHELTGTLDVVTPPYLPERHPRLAELLRRHADRGVRYVPVEEPVHVHEPRRLQLVRNDLENGRTLDRYIRKLRPDACVIMYADHAQLSLAARLRFSFPVSLSGIFFRPSLHYAEQFGDAPASAADRLKRLRKATLLRAALRNPHLRNLFCLDPYVVPYIARMNPRVTPVFLPDGADFGTGGASSQAVRARWDVTPGRRVALMFGVLAARKGLLQLLKAAARLPAGSQRTLCLVLAGTIPDADRRETYALIEQLGHATEVQVVVDERFIPSAEIQPSVRAADLILVPYRRHVGSSNVLIRAAAASRPVLGPDFGLVGAQIQRWRLGRVVDTASPAAIAAGLEAYLAKPDDFPFDPEAARAFALENTAERYAATIFRHEGIDVPTD